MWRPLSPGFPPPRKTAVLRPHHIGLFHYSAYFGTWDLILDVMSTTEVRVVQVNEQGERIGEERTHCTPMWADRFANHPFNVYAWQRGEL